MITKNRFFRKDSKEAIFLSLYSLLIYSFYILSQIVNHISLKEYIKSLNFRI